MHITILDPLGHGVALRCIVNVQVLFLLIVAKMVLFLLFLNGIDQCSFLLHSEWLLAHTTYILCGNESMDAVVQQRLHILCIREMSVTLLVIIVLKETLSFLLILLRSIHIYIAQLVLNNFLDTITFHFLHFLPQVDELTIFELLS